MKFNSQATYYRHRKSCLKSTQNFFKTCDCGKSLHSKTSFYSHKKHCKENTEKKVFKTCDCGKSFASKTAYYAHKKTCNTEKKPDASNEKTSVAQKENKFLPKENYKCQEENCSFSSSTRLDFLSHLKSSHSIDSCWEEKIFQTYEGKMFIKKRMQCKNGYSSLMLKNFKRVNFNAYRSIRQKVQFSKPTNDEKVELEEEILHDCNKIEHNDHSYS